MWTLNIEHLSLEDKILSQNKNQRGGSIETDYPNGEIVLEGRLHGVATPVNRALQVAANRLAREGGKPGDLSLAELRSLVDEYDSRGAGS